MCQVSNYKDIYSIFIQRYVLSAHYKVGTVLRVLAAGLRHKQLRSLLWDVYILKPLPQLREERSVLYEDYFSSSVLGI